MENDHEQSAARQKGMGQKKSVRAELGFEPRTSYIQNCAQSKNSTTELSSQDSMTNYPILLYKLEFDAVELRVLDPSRFSVMHVLASNISHLKRKERWVYSSGSGCLDASWTCSARGCTLSFGDNPLTVPKTISISSRLLPLVSFRNIQLYPMMA